MVEEVSDEAEVRQSSSSLLSAAASFRRPALAVLVLGAAAVIVVVARHTLAKSLHVLAAASPGWLLLALAAEAVSLTAFGLSRTLLLRVNGHRIGLGPVMAITYAAHALGLSVPFAGAELDVVYSYRQFRRAGLDAAATSWSALERLAALSKRVFGKPEAGEAGVDGFLDEVSSRRLSRPGYGLVLVLLGGWVAFIVLAHPLRRRRGR
ncbi:MAG TPA: hypothetical protein VFE26_06410 [Trebonia sp.]|nr:hypothetical protein [Trebonia sp.]